MRGVDGDLGMVCLWGGDQGGRVPCIQVDAGRVISRTGCSALRSCSWWYGVSSRVCVLFLIFSLYTPRAMVDHDSCVIYM